MEERSLRDNKTPLGHKPFKLVFTQQQQQQHQQQQQQQQQREGIKRAFYDLRKHKISAPLLQYV